MNARSQVVCAVDQGLPLSDPEVARFYQREIGLERRQATPALPLAPSPLRPPQAPLRADDSATLRQALEAARAEVASVRLECDARVRSMAVETAKARAAAQTRVAELERRITERETRISRLEQDVKQRAEELADLEAIVRQLNALVRRKEVQLTEMMNEMRGLLRVALCTPANGPG